MTLIKKFIFSIFILSTPYNSKAAMTTVQPIDVFSSETLLQINQASSASGPDHSIIKGRHGYTHYVVDGYSTSRKLVILSHGIGTSQRMYQDLVNRLVDSGFSTLRYDFFGHGYSKYDGDMWFDYTPDVFVDQLEDVLDHVTAGDGKYKEQCLTAIVGHSTGALAAIHSVDRWAMEGANERAIPKIVLLAPALWANKPFVAKVADKIPRLMTFLFKNIKLVKNLIGESYIENMNSAFASDESTGKYIYDTKKRSMTDEYRRLFGSVKGVNEHPFLAAGIVGINGHMIRGDLLSGHRKTFLKVLEKSKTDTLFVWGSLDCSVPIKDHVETVRKWEMDHDSLKLTVADGLGHELLCENSGMIADHILPFLQG